MLRQINSNTSLMEFFRQLLSGAPIVNGVEVELTSAATTSAQTVPHGLGRPYRGAMVVSGDHALSFAFPDAVSDPGQSLTFTQTSATAARRKFWVY